MKNKKIIIKGEKKKKKKNRRALHPKSTKIGWVLSLQLDIFFLLFFSPFIIIFLFTKPFVSCVESHWNLFVHELGSWTQLEAPRHLFSLDFQRNCCMHIPLAWRAGPAFYVPVFFANVTFVYIFLLERRRGPAPLGAALEAPAHFFPDFPRNCCMQLLLHCRTGPAFCVSAFFQL